MRPPNSFNISTLLNISIHAPPRRSATIVSITNHSNIIVFQSTHPREGVRLKATIRFASKYLFQSTHPREGVRPQSASVNSTSFTFQSTHPREGVRQLYCLYHLTRLRNFNPRTPAKECDCHAAVAVFLPLWISIHAPPRRSATLLPLFNLPFYPFQSTHPREGVRLKYHNQLDQEGSISIHAPPRRSATATYSK